MSPAEAQAVYEQMRAANLAAARKAANRLRALEKLADVVGDYARRPDPDPEVVAAHVDVHKASR